RAGRVSGNGWDLENLGDYSVAMGQHAVALGPGSVALGWETTAGNASATAFGEFATASGHGATAFGWRTTASGQYSTAWGMQSAATGLGATAMGFNTVAQAAGSLVIGRYNVIEGIPDAWADNDDPLFVAGNGSPIVRSNALVLRRNGDLTIAGTLTESSDARLKEEIEPLGDVLDRVLRLQPVTYRFREGTNRSRERQIGLL